MSETHGPLRRGVRDALPGVIGLLAATALLWVVEAADAVLPAEFDEAGIVPRDGDGLMGILLAPFLHADFGHLAANTVPLVVLGILAAIAGTARFVLATVIIVVVSGLGVWLTAPSNSVTVGASGVVFGYLGYVLARAVFERSLLYAGVAIAVVLVYGGLVWGVLPGAAGVSWQGHLFGLIGGVLAAWLLRGGRRKVTA